VRRHVADQFIGVDVDHAGADRNADDRVLAFLPAICRPMPFSPRCAWNVRWWRKSTSVFKALVGKYPDAAAIAAVAAIGAARAE
jgi:hypothetical protein